MFETMKRKQSNSNVFNLLVDGCYFIVSGAQWPVCTLYIYIIFPKLQAVGSWGDHSFAQNS